MRLSADMDAPDYFYYVLADRGESDPLALLVFVDGVKNELVLAADNTEGWAECFVIGSDGIIKHDGGVAITERVYGRVEFRIGERVL